MKNDNLLFLTPPGLNHHDGFLPCSWACLKGNRLKFTNIYLRSDIKVMRFEVIHFFLMNYVYGSVRAIPTYRVYLLYNKAIYSF